MRGTDDDGTDNDNDNNNDTDNDGDTDNDDDDGDYDKADYDWAIMIIPSISFTQFIYKTGDQKEVNNDRQTHASVINDVINK